MILLRAAVQYYYYYTSTMVFNTVNFNEPFAGCLWRHQYFPETTGQVRAEDGTGAGERKSAWPGAGPCRYLPDESVPGHILK
jgi:hypothetical protein